MWFVSGIRKRLQALASAVCLLSMTACAAEPRLVDHSFEFDARWDSPDVEILDYRYGTSSHPGARGCPKSYLHCDKTPQQAGISGEMLLGDELYVRWQIKSTGKIYEDTVDLKNHLPEDMRRQRIRFVVWGAQLHVYLISPKRKDGCPDDYSQDALACIRQKTVRNGGVAVGCPPPGAPRCKIAEPCPSADLRIISGSGNCSKEILKLYPGQLEPVIIDFK